MLHTADADTLEYKSIGKATKLREIPRLNSLQNSDFIYSPDGNDGLLVICDVNLRKPAYHPNYELTVLVDYHERIVEKYHKYMRLKT